MERAAREFSPTGFTNEAQIESGIFVETLRLGRKIAKKQELSDQDRDSAVNLYDSVTVEHYKVLWDNLMFQTVIQSDFYVKEAIIHILKAIHFGYVCQLQVTDELKKINGDDLKAKALEAKVVLPLRFFGDGTDNSGAITNRLFIVGRSEVDSEDPINAQQLPIAVQEQLKAEGEKISELLSIDLEKQGLEKLKTELEKIQKSYYKIKNKTYTAAYKEYLEQYQPEIDRYNARLEEIEDLITEETSEEEIRALYAELGVLNVPSFIFEYRDELNFDDFKSKLSLESLKLFVNIFTDANNRELNFSSMNVISDRQLQLGEVVVTMNDEYDNYTEVLEELTERLSFHTQSLFEKTPLNQRVYANLGGVLIPVNDSANKSSSISRTYYLKANQQTTSQSYLTFYYQAESNAWGTASAKIYAVTDFNTYEETYSNISVYGGKVTFPSMLINKFGKVIRQLKIQIFFSNGEEANLEFSGLVMDEPYTGILYTERVKQEIENPSEPGTTPKPGTFIPKNFGIKRLGIADYLKVVQSTHAYVPGEVTHIENVIAKEFKQKSTRRLRRSEIQTTTSKSTERENLSDTTTTSRNDLQSEVANIIQQETNAQAYFRYGGGNKSFEVGGNFATHNSKENSTRQAIAKSQEITEKATERILTKVAEERIEKIIEEFEENNAHGFDNRNGDKHVVGVYRWVDKKMKNQIYNYGKRNMFEFMIPEPAKLHRLATTFTKASSMLTEPVDPRKAPAPQTMADSKSATKDLLSYWAGIYGVKLTEIKETDQQIESIHDEFHDSGNLSVQQRNFGIPANYICKSVEVSYSATKSKSSRRLEVTGDFTNGIGFSKSQPTETFFLGGFNLSGSWVFKNSGYNIGIVDISLKLNLEIKPELFEAWKKENFDAIIQAYETAYADFLAKQKEEEEKAKEEEENNKVQLSNFYREMERVIIKHNCIAFLLQDYLNSNTLGQNLTNNAQTMKEFSVILDENLDQYAALAKFLEQAFEWTIMDYTFYPYYWANRDEWQTMYLSESTDPLFRNFLQAGMARVIVTVNPGFEDAVQFFMTTGKIWNGGEVPVIGDPMYMSIVDEMREPLGLKQGKAWITTLPTSLNILQEDSIGLKTLTALPFTQENPEEFEVPSDVVINDSDFKSNNNLLGVQSNGNSEKVISGDWE
ncbi:hypothetical protein [Chryseobacterium luquanense]|uniref:Tc toxin complex TcA C-terminal TcB-binding domain-containing protein n=1 Tax=Chryseobacterium luquanense TaxID=2983766 RepID=A0ABT3Y5T5_9FLAO|nr:hypothetical protein [Chryseobacterium luquanense]MCX8533518.1 hypothetical protein [Chryseobacterium luquanense]